MATVKKAASKKSPTKKSPTPTKTKTPSAPKSTKELFAGLNPRQAEAVRSIDGPELVVAGAGSGKTRVLTHRIAYLVSQGADPKRILAVTFTNKAANEMAERVDKLVGRFVPISTFHSFCLKVLREERAALGMERGFVIYDQNDQLTLLKECMRLLNITEKHKKPQFFANQIGLAKDRLETAEKFASHVDKYEDSAVAEVYREYEKELKRGRALDFDDLIMQTVLLFKRRPEILEKYQKRFDYVLVDEFQDTNYAQYQLVKMLVKKHSNLFIVGDPDQSIYRFRGAEIGNLLEFEKDFPKAKKIVLEENYRSTKAILDAANDVISVNPDRMPKNLKTERKEGRKIVGYAAGNEEEEADYVVKTIKKILKEDPSIKRRDIVIFYRVHVLSRGLEQRLVREKIPYKLVGDVGFYNRREIKDQLAYMRAALNPYDDVSLRRIINTPPRGLGETTQNNLANFAQTAGISFYEALLQQDRVSRINDAARRRLKKFRELLEELIEAQKKLKPSDFLNLILEKTNYIELVCPEDDEEDENRRGNISEFMASVVEYENAAKDGQAPTTEGFLNEVALTADIDKWNNESNGVTLMTIHNAKGLEFPIVFMVGLEEEIFPHVKTQGIKSEIEEERRLCYVGMTRAKERLYLTCSLSRFMFNKRVSRDPSRFLGEIDPSHIEMQRSRVKSLLSESIKTSPNLPSRPAATPELGELTVGLRVQHTHFGSGTISSIMGSGPEAPASPAGKAHGRSTAGRRL